MASGGGLRGFLPAIVTPLNADKTVDVPSIRRLARHMFDEGVAGLYVGGNTGEGYVLADAERRTLTEVCVDECRNANKCAIIHIGHPDTASAIALAVHAKEVGADAISSMPPFQGGGVTFADVHQFYRDLAAAVTPLPVVAYHIPAITGMQMTSSELVSLLDIEGVVGFKYTDADLYKLDRTLALRPDAIFFHGHSTVQVPALLYGARGGITGGGGNVTPGLMSKLHAAVDGGDYTGAMVFQREFNAIQEALFGPFSAKMVATFKALLVWQGVIASGTMAKEAHLTADEAAAFLAALRSIPSIRDTLTSADANLYT